MRKVILTNERKEFIINNSDKMTVREIINIIGGESTSIRGFIYRNGLPMMLESGKIIKKSPRKKLKSEDVFDVNKYENWHIVRNYDEFITYIETNEMPELISFDHDLADEHYRPSMMNPDGHYSNYYTDGTFKEKTGCDCAKWLIEYCRSHKVKLPLYICHSMNPIGKKNILELLNGKK